MSSYSTPSQTVGAVTYVPTNILDLRQKNTSATKVGEDLYCLKIDDKLFYMDDKQRHDLVKQLLTAGDKHKK